MPRIFQLSECQGLPEFDDLEPNRLCAAGNWFCPTEVPEPIPIHCIALRLA